MDIQKSTQTLFEQTSIIILFTYSTYSTHMHVQNLNFKCRYQSVVVGYKRVTHIVCNVYSTWVLLAVRRFNPGAEIFTFYMKCSRGCKIYFFLRQFFMWKNILCPTFWLLRNICTFRIRSILTCQVRLVT